MWDEETCTWSSKVAGHVERYNFMKLSGGRSSFWSRTVSIAARKTSKVLHVTIYVKAKRVVAHNRYLFPTCLIASNYFTGACQRHRSIYSHDGRKPAVRLHYRIAQLRLSRSIGPHSRWNILRYTYHDTCLKILDVSWNLLNLLRWKDVPRTSRIFCPKIAIFSQF